MRNDRRGLYVGLAVGLVAGVAMAQRSAAPARETVTIQLKWKHQFQFAGYYAAIAKGLYAAEGLQVILKERQEAKNAVESVLDGEAEYGVDDVSLLFFRLEGKPVVLLAQIFQHSPMVLLAKRESGIVSPYEMVGKRVMMNFGQKHEAHLTAMLVETLGSRSRLASTTSWRIASTSWKPMSPTSPLP